MKQLTNFSVLAIIFTIATLQSCTKIGSMLQYDIPLQSGFSDYHYSTHIPNIRLCKWQWQQHYQYRLSNQS